MWFLIRCRDVFWIIGELSEPCVKRRRQSRSLCTVLLSFCLWVPKVSLYAAVIHKAPDEVSQTIHKIKANRSGLSLTPGSDYTTSARLWHSVVMANKFPALDLNMNVGNNRQASHFDRIKEQRCGFWDAPRFFCTFLPSVTSLMTNSHWPEGWQRVISTPV